MALVVSGCATTQAAKPPDIQWPPQPSPARVRLSQVAYGPEDFGASRPWYARLWNFIAGDDETAVFVEPFAVALRGERLAVGDTRMGRVWVIDLAEKTYHYFDRIDGDFIRAPVGLAMVNDGIWVSDAERNSLQKVSLNGDLLEEIVVHERPAGLAASDDGRLAVAFPAAHKVRVYDRGTHLGEIGGVGAGQGQFNFPSQVAFGTDGALFVNDALNFRIQQFDRGLRFVSMFGQRGDASGYFGRSRGLAVDGRQRIYVADALFDVVQVFGDEGNLFLVIGTGGAEPGEFWLPGGLAYDAQRIAIADTQNQRVQILEVVQ